MRTQSRVGLDRHRGASRRDPGQPEPDPVPGASGLLKSVLGGSSLQPPSHVGASGARPRAERRSALQNAFLRVLSARKDLTQRSLVTSVPSVFRLEKHEGRREPARVSWHSSIGNRLRHFHFFHPPFQSRKVFADRGQDRRLFQG